MRKFELLLKWRKRGGLSKSLRTLVAACLSRISVYRGYYKLIFWEEKSCKVRKVHRDLPNLDINCDYEGISFCWGTCISTLQLSVMHLAFRLPRIKQHIALQYYIKLEIVDFWQSENNGER
eukprot:TRINITY_DN84771_c0_g1_i1.p3 TRINITY_DN84771_c0_g1~~TRINITY_DN84771_c0_g1_i1.p3  ORF type:complete len:121 (-),score=4.36 TRINITY_DN84771_c0_g1_i1:190-552(-)